MDIRIDYRIDSILAHESELALAAERARIAAERALRPVQRPVTATGSLVCVPVTSH